MDSGSDKTTESGSVILRDRESAPRYEAKVARKKPSREEVRAQLESKSADISARLSALQSDVFGSSRKAKELLSDSPVIPVVGSLVAGIVVGLIFGGSKRGRKAGSSIAPEIGEVLVRKVNEANEAGVDPVAAVNQSMNRLLPAADVPKRKSAGVLGAIGGLVVNLAVRQAITYIERRFTGEDPDGDAA